MLEMNWNGAIERRNSLFLVAFCRRCWQVTCKYVVTCRTTQRISCHWFNCAMKLSNCNMNIAERIFSSFAWVSWVECWREEEKNTFYCIFERKTYFWICKPDFSGLWNCFCLVGISQRGLMLFSLVISTKIGLTLSIDDSMKMNLSSNCIVIDWEIKFHHFSLFIIKLEIVNTVD